jgi:hypothetical protein
MSTMKDAVGEDEPRHAVAALLLANNAGPAGPGVTRDGFFSVSRSSSQIFSRPGYDAIATAKKCFAVLAPPMKDLGVAAGMPREPRIGSRFLRGAFNSF